MGELNINTLKKKQTKKSNTHYESFKGNQKRKKKKTLGKSQQASENEKERGKSSKKTKQKRCRESVQI